MQQTEPNITREKTCCFSGHRVLSSEEAKDCREDVLQLITKLYARGVKRFITGGALGFDTLAALEVLKARAEKFPDVRLCVAIPCPEQADRWHERDRKLYETILSSADEKIVISPQYTVSCMHERNRWMVDHSGYLIGFCRERSGGTYQTMRYAEKSGILMCNLALRHKEQ